MTIILYDLTGAGGRSFSPFCWRARMALAHKGLDVEMRPTCFTEIAAIAGGGHKTVPVIDDNGAIVGDSLAIADYLEDNYPDRPSLYGPGPGRPFGHFVSNWATTLVPVIVRMIVLDIHDRLDPRDRDYFRTSRERRFAMSLEEVQRDREHGVEQLGRQLMPLRRALAEAPFMGGEQPFYGDYAVFAALQWARVISTFDVLKADDPIRAWFERCLDLHGGLGRAHAPAD